MTAQDTYDEREGSVFAEYPGIRIEYRDASHRYWLHADDVRSEAMSVTTALKVLSKEALLRWYEQRGAEGACRLAHDGMLDTLHAKVNPRSGEITVERRPSVRPENAIYVVRELQLGADAKKEEGAHRGTVTHQVLEVYHRDETVPNLSDFAPEHRGFVTGLVRWLMKAVPTPVLVEGIVGSVEHGFAGRVDLIAEVAGAVRVVDLKTNPAGRIFDESHLQAAAYDLAARECGIQLTGTPLLLAVDAAGSLPEPVESDATAEDFLSVLATARVMGRLRRLREARARAAKKDQPNEQETK